MADPNATPVQRLSRGPVADKGGSPLAQIQRTLGHASIQTTERYVGYDLDLQNAPSDYFKLDFAP